jgi:exodeoxyribonuclease V alpha subunit
LKKARQFRNRAGVVRSAQHPTPPDAPSGRPNDIAVEPFLANEDFREIDRHFARFMERLSGGSNPQLVMAAALASYFQGQGSICVDLRQVAGTVFPPGNAGDVRTSLLPDLQKWLAALREAAVVGSPGDFKPLVLDEQGRLYLHRYREYEASLSRAIRQRAQGTPPGIDETLLQRGLERFFPATSASGAPDVQRAAASTAVRNKFCVICGGPGTGKTRTVIVLLALLLEQSGDEPLRIALAAPTGKAAARLQESLQKWKPTLPCTDAVKARLPDESFTLHRLLGGLPDSTRFKYDRENPLPFDVVVVDEASMVDLALMSKLFAATPSTARLILLGDKDQLASVQAGSVLGDICQRPSEPVSHPLASCIVELQTNYRSGADNGILALSQSINDGDANRALGLLSWQGDPDNPTSTPALTQSSARHRPASDSPLPTSSLVSRTGSGVFATMRPTPARLKDRLRGQAIDGFGEALRLRDPVAALKGLNRFRILCAVRMGAFGVESLNRTVEEILSEAGIISTRERWYAGRPILVTRNDPALKLFNGDIGIILPDPASGELRAWFHDPDGAARSLPPVRLPEHETVFAMTVHKSQGSEFDEVMFILPDRDSPVVTRELLYTGVSRASRRVEMWFDQPTFRAAVARRVVRASGLRDALWAGYG